MIDFSYHPDCTDCPLHETATNVGIGGDGGLENVDILLIGEAPGADEDLENLCFVGETGKLMRDCLQGYIKGPTWRLTNAARCRPFLVNEKGYKENRQPSPGEFNACRKHLVDEINKIKPQIIVPMGDIALQSLLGAKYRGITKWRGSIIEAKGYLIIPTWHPSHVLRQMPDPRSSVPSQFVQDLQLICSTALYGKVKENINVWVPKTHGEFREAIELLKRQDGFMVHDWETNTFEDTSIPTLWHKGAKDLSVAVAYSPTEAIAFATNHRESPFSGTPMLYEIAKVLSEKKMGAHNAKFDAECGWRFYKQWIFSEYDTLLMHYLLDEDESHSLEEIMRTKYPGLAATKSRVKNQEAELKAKSKRNFKANPSNFANGYENLPLDELLYYNAVDAIATYRLKNDLEKELKEFPKRWKLFLDVFTPVSHMLARVEAEGLVPNLEAKNVLEKEYEKKLEVIEEKIVTFAVQNGMPDTFNPGSMPQLRTLLFDKLNLPILTKTKKTGLASTDKDVLLNLRTHSQVPSEAKKFIDLLISHLENGIETESFRSISKLLGTYIKPLEDYVGEDEKIHCELMQHGTVTNRLSCKFPNLQNVPVNIRALFRPPGGYTCVEFDASQIELRGIAVAAGEENMKQVFRSGGDIHKTTGKTLFKTDEMTKEQRVKAKGTNFGIIYCESAQGLANNINVSVAEAQRLIDGINKAYPGLPLYVQKQQSLAKKDALVELPWGSVRHLRGVLSPEKLIYEKALRQAVNSPIQNMAGLICLTKMATLSNIIDWDTCRMVLTIHDSIDFFIRVDMMKYWLPIIKTTLEDTSTLPFYFDVPLVWECSWGSNLKDLESLEIETKQLVA